MKVPRWLKIQERVDYLMWELGEMMKEADKLSPIEVMIDKSTGFDKKRLAIFKRKAKEVKKLKDEYYKLMGSK